MEKTVDECIQQMIDEGFYRYKPENGALVMFNGKKTWSYKEFVETRQLIIDLKRDGSPKYLNLNTIDMDRQDFPIIIKTINDINRPFGKVKDEPVFNTAKLLDVKFHIESVNNNEDTSIFWNHLEYLCGNVEQEVKDWVRDWVADIFQNPNDKKGTALVFIGGQGCGKSIFFSKLMSKLLGEYFHYADGKDYSQKFNKELQDKLLINFDEGFATKNKAAEAKLKSFVTEPYFKIEAKGINSVNVFNPARAVFTTNSSFATNTADDDRRHAIFRTIKKKITKEEEKEYFDAFGEAIKNEDLLKKFMYELQNRKITSNLRTPPVTEEKEAQKAFSASKVEDWFDFIIQTPKDYKMTLNDNSQSTYNFKGYLWADYNKPETSKDERWMFGDNGFKSFLGFHGKNEHINSRQKLFSALKIHLANHKEWEILPKSKNIRFNQHIGGGFNFDDKGTQNRVWIFKKKPSETSVE
jgi:outer membrane lipoprotein-sorting protein